MSFKKKMYVVKGILKKILLPKTKCSIENIILSRYQSLSKVLELLRVQTTFLDQGKKFFYRNYYL